MKILTFDIEDWFHLLDVPETSSTSAWEGFESRIEGNVCRILEAVKSRGYKATFFCLGWVGEKYPQVVRQIDNEGFEVASHSHFHELVYLQDKVRFKEDLIRSIGVLEGITGKKITSYRAPGFSLVPQTPWVFETLAEMGIERDSSIFPASRAHGGFPQFGAARPAIVRHRGTEIKEFPISLGRVLGRQFVFSGGGYFRLFPYPVLDCMVKKSDYLMTYFHPRDFDAGQPILDLPPVKRFKSYFGLRGSFQKFERLLDEYEFVDLETADSQINWNTAPVIDVV